MIAVNKVLELAQSLNLKPGLHEVRVEHDHWCSIYSGTGVCNCNPDVSLETSSDDVEEHVQFTIKAGKALREGGERYKKIGRNEPCPCGSEVKFKRCHGAVNFVGGNA